MSSTGQQLDINSRKDYLLRMIAEAKLSVRRDSTKARISHLRYLRKCKEEDLMKESEIRMQEFDSELKRSDEDLQMILEDCEIVSNQIVSVSRSAATSMQEVAEEFKKTSEGLRKRLQQCISGLQGEFETDMRDSEKRFLHQRSLLEELITLASQEYSEFESAEHLQGRELLDLLRKTSYTEDRNVDTKIKSEMTSIEQLLEMHAKEAAEFCEPREKECKAIVEQVRLRGERMKERMRTIKKVSREITVLKGKKDAMDNGELDALKREKEELIEACNKIKLRIEKETRANSGRLSRLAILFDGSKVKIEKELDMCDTIERHIRQLGTLVFPVENSAEKDDRSVSRILDLQLAEQHVRVAQIELENKIIKDENTFLKSALEQRAREKTLDHTIINQQLVTVL